MHAINNTALVAAALFAFDGDFSAAIGGVVQGGWDTDTNGAAVGSIFGALGPDRRALVGAADAASRARCPGSTGSTLTSSLRPTRRGRMTTVESRRPARPRPIDRPTAVRSRRRSNLDGAKIIAAPDDPADWPAWRGRSRAGVTRRAPVRLRRKFVRAARPGPSVASPSRWSWLWDDLLYDFEAEVHAGTVLLTRDRAAFGGYDASCSGTPTR